jgi:hypothetical protein
LPQAPLLRTKESEAALADVAGQDERFRQAPAESRAPVIEQLGYPVRGGDTVGVAGQHRHRVACQQEVAEQVAPQQSRGAGEQDASFGVRHP